VDSEQLGEEVTLFEKVYVTSEVHDVLPDGSQLDIHRTWGLLDEDISAFVSYYCSEGLAILICVTLSVCLTGLVGGHFYSSYLDAGIGTR
jgi:hypothetical protein